MSRRRWFVAALGRKKKLNPLSPRFLPASTTAATPTRRAANASRVRRIVGWGRGGAREREKTKKRAEKHKNERGVKTRETSNDSTLCSVEKKKREGGCFFALPSLPQTLLHFSTRGLALPLEHVQLVMTSTSEKVREKFVPCEERKTKNECDL